LAIVSVVAGRVAIVFHGVSADGQAPAPSPRLAPIFSALAEMGLDVEPVGYSAARVDQVHDRLLAADGVLVWVDPIGPDGDRVVLDTLLREAAATGAWIGSHPDVIARMGTKEVLYTTRRLGWGVDTHLYSTPVEFRRLFPARLAADGIRVVKPSRGNGGRGVWKVILGDGQGGSPVPGPEVVVTAQNARIRDEIREELPLGQFLDRCAVAFAGYGGAGRLIDQAFARRLGHGIIRCYLVRDRVAGFARQYPPQLSPDERAERGLALDAEVPAETIMGLPSAKTMYAPDDPAFARLRGLVEQEWVPGMQAILGLETGSLPVLWDADFLFGPKTAEGQDSYVLCEINASCVTPFPPEAVPLLARATAQAVAAVRTGRLGSWPQRPRSVNRPRRRTPPPIKTMSAAAIKPTLLSRAGGAAGSPRFAGRLSGSQHIQSWLRARRAKLLTLLARLSSPLPAARARRAWRGIDRLARGRAARADQAH
jgi:hypothetical protein